MKPNALVKLATVASSVLLLAAFVSYRAGPLSWIGDAGARSADSTTSVPATAVQPPSMATEQDRTIMSSSKSMFLGGKPIIETVKWAVTTTKSNFLRPVRQTLMPPLHPICGLQKLRNGSERSFAAQNPTLASKAASSLGSPRPIPIS
jgi:hypothetical protein